MTTDALRVLVVDDDAPVRELIAEALEHEGYAVATAADGLEALEWLDRARADAIVLDYAMPRCDGPAFAAAYRERPGAPAPSFW
jgi:CheY-like chemotaxis protein